MAVPDGGGTSDAVWFSSLAEVAGIQPVVGLGAGFSGNIGTETLSLNVRLQILDGATLIADVTLQGSVTQVRTSTTVSSTGSLTENWAVGFVPVTDTIVPAGSRDTTTYPITATYYPSGSINGVLVRLYGTYSHTYVPPGAILRVSGTASVTPGGMTGGFFLSTKPQAAFTNAGGTTGTLAVDGSASQDSMDGATYINDADNFISQYLWDWGDGSTTSTAIPTASHEYDDSGAFVVSLTVYDHYAGRNTTSSSIAITAEGGRTITFVHDGLGFTIRSRVSGTPRTLTTDRHNGIDWSTPLRTTTAKQKPALSKPHDEARLFQIVQNVSSKAWELEYSDDAANWQTMSTPFDSTYKAVTRVAWALGVGKVAGINASNVIVCKTTYDGGLTFTQDAQSPGSGSKSLDLAYNPNEGRFEIVADNSLFKGTRDFTGATAWTSI